LKKLLIALLILTLCTSCASATILPATGVDEGFKAWTGIDCTPAVVLCESLSILNNRGDQGGKRVETLYYSGNTIPVIESWDGYAKIYYSDGNETGWVRSDYLLMDPAWYLCDEDVQVYAYPDTMAPRVALLDKGTKLPIITQWDDAKSVNGWVCVSLRGAAGWIRKTPKDTANETWFRPEMLADIGGAVLQMGDNAVGSTDKAVLTELSRLLTNVEDKGGPVAGCPFTATLTLMTETGNSIELALATDSCCVYRVDGRDYAYARHLWSEEAGSPDNGVLFKLFGIDPQIFHAS
jgi:hypothetical protein